MAKWNERIADEEDKRRERGLNRRLEEFERELKEEEKLEKRRILINRILHILDELKTEAFEYDENKLLLYTEEYERILEELDRKKEEERDEIERHHSQDTSWQEYRDEEEDFER